MASKNGIPYSTARGWVAKNEVDPKSRGGVKHKKLGEEHVDEIVSWLEENCQLTLKQMKERLQFEFGVSVSTTTIGNRLEGRMFTVKRAYGQPINMNAMSNKEGRKAYLEKLSSFIQGGKYIVYTDESNLNLFCRRNVGRSKAGSKANVLLPNSKGPNVHMLGGISMDGLMFFERLRGAVRMEEYRQWLESLLVCMRDEKSIPLSTVVVVIDNAPSHSRVEEIKRIQDFRNVEILRLAPYSSSPLNAIEHMWSKLKSFVKKWNAERFQMMISTPEEITQTEHRLQFLEGLIDEASIKITALDCSRFITHVSSHFADCINLKDLSL